MKIWNFIRSKLKEDQKVMLLIVIDSHGSSPGRRGFKMAVSGDGEILGSVGGGVMEYRMVELAKKHFKSPFEIFSKIENHNSKNTSNSSGMICSGSQQVAFYPLDKQYLSIIESLTFTKNGNLTFTESGFQYNSETDLSSEFISKIQDEYTWSFSEQLGFKDHLIVFGAGHVGKSVSRIFKQLGFYITVFDNRDHELTTFSNNRFAHSKKIIDFNEVAKYIVEGNNVYVVIMTFNHLDDEKILKQLIDKNIGYLGMMGSPEKVKSVFQKLRSKGITSQQLKKVDAPIGIPINSHAPDEIAISIAAKVISVKNERLC
ncbi:MAG: XdhC family protein [Bacteroidota bacterium]